MKEKNIKFEENMVGAKPECVHFMVWQCFHGHSVCRCSKCDYIDMDKTFADYVKKEAIQEHLDNLGLTSNAKLNNIQFVLERIGAKADNQVSSDPVEKVEDILFKKASEIATARAKDRELEVNAWIAQHGKTKLLFGRWLFILCDMKKFKFKERVDL